MTTISEGVQTTLRYKANSSGVITANTLADTTTIPGTTGGQLLRRVGSTIAFNRNAYEAQEVRADRQEVDVRLGTGSVTGDITGELSPATYFDLIEAQHRDTRVAALTITNSTPSSGLGTATGSNSASTWTFSTGDPVLLGLFVGDVIRFTNLSVTADNSVNYTIMSFGGTTNETVTVSPAPTDQTADVAWSLTRVGKATIIPAAAHVSRLFTFEHYSADTDTSELFIECRVAKYMISLPATGLATFSASVAGRWAYDLATGSSPYLAAPSAETTTGITASVNGQLLLNGTAVGTVSGVTITNEMTVAMAEVAGQNFPAAISLGRNRVSGNLTAYVDGSTIPALYKAETECQLLLVLYTTSAADSPVISIFMPRIKFTSAPMPVQGEGLQQINATFRALRYVGPINGYPSTTIRIQDSEA